MRELVFSPALLHRLPPDAPIAAWTALVEETGLLTLQIRAPAADATPPDAEDADWSPALGVAWVQRRLEEAKAAEAIALAEAPAELPVALWVLVGAVLLGLILFAPLAVAVLGPAAIGGGIVFAVLVALFTVVDRRRRVATRRAVAARERLLDALEDLTARTFVGTVDGVLLVCVPDLEEARALLEALALSDPEAPVRAALVAALEAAEARLEALRAAPEEPWTDQGLLLDLTRWADAIDQIA